MKTLATNSLRNSMRNLCEKLILTTLLTVGIFNLTINAQKAELIVQSGHSSLVNSVAFSPDGRILASGSNDKTVKLWDVKSGRELKTFHSPPNSINSVAFSPDGKSLVSASDIIQVFDLETGNEIKVLEDNIISSNSVAFSPDGKTIASGNRDNTISLWNLTNGKKLRSLNSHNGVVTSVIFSPNGRILASTSSDKTIKFWDIVEGKVINTLSDYANGFESIDFSPNGKSFVSASSNKTIKLWDVESGKLIKSFGVNDSSISSIIFSPDGKLLATGSWDKPVKLWNAENGKIIKSLNGNNAAISSIDFSLDGKILATGSWDNSIKLWDIESGKPVKSLGGNNQSISSIDYSPDGRLLASGNWDNTIKIWDAEKGSILKILKGHFDWVHTVAFSPDGETLASGSQDTTIKLWGVKNGKNTKTLRGHYGFINTLVFSPNGKILASGGKDSTIKLWDVKSGKNLKTLIGHNGSISEIKFSLDGLTLASSSGDTTVKLWNIESGKEIKTFRGNTNSINSLALSPNGKTFAFGNNNSEVKILDIESGKEIKSLTKHTAQVYPTCYSIDGKSLFTGSNDKTIKIWEVENGKEITTFYGHTDAVFSLSLSPYRKILASGSGDGTIKLWSLEKRELLASLITIDKKDWVIMSLQGRFDTNKSLDKTEGLQWVVSDQPFKPLPLDIFMRQYSEPNLLPRLLKCTEENNCDKEFKPLPSIAEINRVQPNVKIKEIKLVADSADLADVTIEVENVTAEVSLSATDKTQKKQLSSGAFDLRLFREGQLVGVSTPKDKLAQFIADAPRLVAENKASGKLIDTPEDKAWREANDIFKIKDENVKKVSPTKIEYTFRNIKLPRDGRKEVEFTAYAFNSDKVKSTTTEPFKFTIPESVAKTPKKGRAYLISIGVNASENPAYNLRYAVNDARKMQEVVGERLKANSEKFAEVVQVPLVSDYGQDGNLSVNTAQKAIIKGVFSVLSGNGKEVPQEVLKQIPNREKIKQIEPEDTLIISFSGHGYADNTGLFYLLPYDIGEDTAKLTPEVLQKTISSDELSLWMQDITATEMIMIIDACHSSAAVQGDGFKPGPMGSRGLGQLAYDKDMKILSATQADNVALELGSLQQGLLSYALLQDGIVKGQADADKNKQLFSNEWLTFAEKRVPELYQEVKEGKRNIFVDGKYTKGAEIVVTNQSRKSKLNLQQPTVFDFKRRKTDNSLIALP